MDLRKRLVYFTRLIRLLAFVYLVIQFIVVRERYQASQMIPVIAGLGVFYIIMDRIIFRVPEERFKSPSLALMLFEMFLVSLLIYFTRSNPIREFEYLYVLPVANVALWFGLREGISYAAAASAAGQRPRVWRK